MEVDLIVIPSIVGDPTLTLAKNKGLIAWLMQMRGKGAQVASLCTGAYLLAATELM